MKAFARGSLVVAASLALAASAGAAPTVAITSPAEGASISKAETPMLTVAGLAAFETPAPTKQTYYLRRSQCASGSDDARLSVKRGTSREQSGCGYVAQPLNEVYILMGDEGLSYTYPAEDGVPFTLDATRAITGALKMAGGAGTATVEVRLSGTASNGESVTLGTFTKSYNTTLGTVTHEFTMQPDASLDKRDFADLSLWIRTRGVNVLHGSVDHRNGVSNLTLPTYTTSFTPTVEFALDSPAFAPTATRKATLAEDGTWTGSVATPAVGVHKVYARATQGADVTTAAPVTFTVTQ